MCKWIKSGANRIDPCMRKEILDMQSSGITTLASCCGHGKYHKTIIIKTPIGPMEYYIQIPISRKKRFYMRDKNGVFYIPEVEEWYRLDAIDKEEFEKLQRFLSKIKKHTVTHSTTGDVLIKEHGTLTQEDLNMRLR
jgi:hypothetical protein